MADERIEVPEEGVEVPAEGAEVPERVVEDPVLGQRIIFRRVLADDGGEDLQLEIWVEPGEASSSHTCTRRWRSASACSRVR